MESLASRTPADAAVTTQGFVLRADDLVTTLAVEAAVHSLDLAAGGAGPAPAAAALAVVRRTLDGLLGRPAPAAWDDVSWALVGTGRRPPTEEERRVLGADVDRLPLLG